MKSVGLGGRYRGNLPPEPRSFIGRRRELASAQRLLSQVRLLTVTGPPGVGKTRLSLRLARRTRRRFRDGVWLVDFSTLTDPDLVAETVADTLGIRDGSQRPIDALLAHLADQRMLILLDNCEHLVDACADLAQDLLSRAAGLRILASSRRTLGVIGEHVMAVTPMSLPGDGCSPEEAASSEAGELFMARATRAAPGFVIDAENCSAVAEICRRLDGIPLAIELAAVRLRTLPLERLRASLHERFALLTEPIPTAAPHHHTLLAAIDWSYHLCSAAQQRLWARASVFPGGFDLETAEAVCSDDTLPAEDVLWQVADLVDMSVLVRDGARFGFLDTLRHYGRRRLDEFGETARLRRRHRDHYLRFVEEAETHWFGPDQSSWFEHVQQEHANIRAALEFSCTEPGQAHIALHMSALLWFYWVSCGYLSEGHYWLTRTLALNRDTSSDRITALWVDAWILARLGDLHQATAIIEEARAAGQATDDATTLANLARVRGTIELFSNDLTPAAADLEEAVRLDESAGGPRMPTIMAMPTLGAVYALLGNTSRAADVCHRGRIACEQRGEKWVLSWLLWTLALIAWLRDDIPQSQDYARQALRATYDFHDLVGTALSLELLAWTAVADGDHEHAARLFGANENLWKRTAMPLFGFSLYHRWHEGNCRRTRDALGDAAFDTAFAEGRRWNARQAVTTAARRVGEYR